jgi:hypothetical protein
VTRRGTTFVVRHLAFRALVWITFPILRATARVARLVERARDDGEHAVAALVLLLAWAPCRCASLALFAACNALAPAWRQRTPQLGGLE